MLGNFTCIFPSDIYVKLTFQSKTFFFRDTIRVSNSLDPDQDQHIVGSGLGAANEILPRIACASSLESQCAPYNTFVLI